MKNNGTARYLIFALRGAQYALDLQDVAEVVEPPPTFPIPCAPGHFVGIMNFHGNLTSVLDLANFQNMGNLTPEGKVLVLDSRLANLALWVDSVISIVSAESLRRESAVDDEMTAELLHNGTDKIRLLALDNLIQKLEATIND
ncbi:chemotaxis protein CheW [Geotalea uraniireducens]|uniref:Putative CheW protein n=1 Tax=Geotalea uraniireducens (strain Rf4) TaxID=351605 RepID=A5GBW6_GEOUR|nr:chemotaxis protein CheW [Geotalea uraniireducens]ABQ24933.1 putative CheW protein [Geotalea uraniireducens Rf4]